MAAFATLVANEPLDCRRLPHAFDTRAKATAGTRFRIDWQFTLKRCGGHGPFPFSHSITRAMLSATWNQNERPSFISTATTLSRPSTTKRPRYAQSATIGGDFARGAPTPQS